MDPLEGARRLAAKVTDSPEDGVQDTWAKGVAGAAAVFGALATTVGTFATATGGLGRMFRDQPAGSLAAVFLIGVGAVCAIFFPALRPGTKAASRRWRSQWLALAALFLIAGLVTGVLTAVLSTQSEQRPTIAGEVAGAGAPVLTSTITAAGLSSSDIVHVRITGYGARLPEGDRIYSGEVGADVDGRVKLELQRPLRVGLYDRLTVQAWLGGKRQDCNDVADNRVSRGDRTGCLLLALPTPPLRPLLTTTLTGEGGRRSLTIVATAAEVPVSATLWLRAIDQTGNSIYDTIVGADKAGGLRVDITVPVSKAIGSLCIASRIAAIGTPDRPTCTGSDSVWAVLPPAT